MTISIPPAARLSLQVARKIVEPFGAARSNHGVIRGPAKRLGADHPGFSMSARELIEHALAASNLSDAGTIYAAGGIDMALPFGRAHFLDGFGHADRRFHFEADWAAVGPSHRALPRCPTMSR